MTSLAPLAALHRSTQLHEIHELGRLTTLNLSRNKLVALDVDLVAMVSHCSVWCVVQCVVARGAGRRPRRDSEPVSSAV